MSDTTSSMNSGAPAVGGVVPVDWDALRAAAREINVRAYVPYSRYRVGAAALVDDGRVVRGCNVENASYGVTLCAECGMISELIAGGGGRLVAFTCCNELGECIMPCGRCRQLLAEHGGPGLLVDTPEGVWPLSRVLPQAFGVEDIGRVVDDGRAGEGRVDDGAAGEGRAREGSADDVRGDDGSAGEGRVGDGFTAGGLAREVHLDDGGAGEGRGDDGDIGEGCDDGSADDGCAGEGRVDDGAAS